MEDESHIYANERPIFCPPVCLEAAYALVISQEYDEYAVAQPHRNRCLDFVWVLSTRHNDAITAITQHLAVLVRPDVSEFDDACAAKVRFPAWREMILRRAKESWTHQRNAHFTSLITQGPCIGLASRDGQNRLSMGDLASEGAIRITNGES